ncbi:hypothetical protein [Dactylosporangium darangshiense]|uniref:hypothetical protein n=1 Tax=Dactylosporangium darangshiense TaxID=579108 RepID=UPI00364227FE
MEEVHEVAGIGALGEVIALALHDVRSEVRRRPGDKVSVEEARIPNENAPDDRVVARRDRLIPVATDSLAHLLLAGSTVAFAKQLHASEIGKRANPLKKPPPTTRLCGW